MQYKITRTLLQEAYCNGIRRGSESTVLQGHEYARTIITPLACRISKVYGYFR